MSLTHPALPQAVAAALLGLSLPLRAQDPTSFDALDIHRGIEYANVGGRSLKLDLYIPHEVPKPMPVVVWIHGGGWREGNRDISQGLPLVPLGFAVASIDYRLSQEAIFPAQIYDCKAAVRWVRAHAAEYGFNAAKIGAAGASAGGHLAALLGTTGDRPELEGTEGNPGISSAVQVVCDFFGPTNFTDLTRDYSASPTNFVAELLGGPIVQNWEKARLASPVNYVDAKTCPFYIAHGDQDTVVPVEQSIELASALKKAGIPCTLYIVKGGGHGFRDPPAFIGSVEFLRRYLQ